MYKNTLKIILLVAFIIIINGCSSRDTVATVTFREYKKIEQLRGQPPKIYVRASDSYVYIFSHSNYSIQNDTLFGKDNSGRVIVLTNIKSITYNDYDIEQDIEVHYDADKDSILGYKYAGAEVYIEMNDGSDYKGELLSVRDSKMIVCEEYDADEQELADSVYAIYVLNNRDIKLIELYVGNYLGEGMVVGSLAGGGVGLAAYSVSGTGGPYDFSSLHNMGVAMVGGFVGAMIGGTMGFFITDYENVYEQAIPEEYDFKKLNIYARYVNNEPEYLKNVK